MQILGSDPNSFSLLGAVTCPVYPQSEAGQAAFVINNVSARAIFVENAQQAAKVASVRDQCPTLEHVISFEASGKLPPGTLTLDDVPYVITGIAPDQFNGHLPLNGEMAVFLPLERNPRFRTNGADRSNGWLLIHGRLAPGVSVAQASAAVSAVTSALATR